MAGRFPDIAPMVPPSRSGAPVGLFPSPPGSVSFTRKPLSGTATIDALMARQKAAAMAQQGALATPQTTLPGGIGQMLNSYLAGKREYDAAQEEAAGRAELAAAISGIDQTTGIATPEQLSTIYSRDPDAGLALMQSAIAARRAQSAAELAATQRTEERGWSVEDREDAQAAAAALAASKVEQWEDIPTPEGAPPGQRFQRNKTTGETKAIGGSGVTIQNMPAEVGARVGLADVFLRDYDDIYASVASGANTGLIDYTTSAIGGRGDAGETYRKIQSGVDALRRGLTGAGMAISEAQEYANRYLPTWKDDAASAASKLEGLKADLEGVRSGATLGRNAPPAPETGAAAPQPEALPPGVTEEDIQYTLENHPEMTREQLLEQLRGGNAP